MFQTDDRTAATMKTDKPAPNPDNNRNSTRTLGIGSSAGKSGVVSMKSSRFPAAARASLDDLAAYRLLVTAAFGVGWSNAAPPFLGYTKRTVQRWLRGDRAMPYRVIRTLQDKLVRRIASLPALEAEERRRVAERRQVLGNAMTVARRLVKRGPVNPSAGRNAGRPTGRTLIAVPRAKRRRP